ncbi:MAG: amidohydrolase, partial [Lentisphaeria bacterium]|nr:amidohydrolase [Lentisphaeria bacterium]
MNEKLASVLNTERESLRTLCRFIHANPELGLEEFQACAALKEYLAQHGFEVRANAGGLETAFMGYCSSEGAAEDVPLLGFIAEYDALPGMGHGCGHNLIATSAVAALLAAREILDKEKIPYRLCCMGTPAEEGKGGKILMLRNGAFDGISAILEAHPGSKTTPDVGELSIKRCNVAFHGKAAHAAISPEKGCNALEAACDFICALKEWKKTLGSRERVHGILTKGGDAPKIIPDYAEAFYYLRAPNEKYLAPMQEHFTFLAEKAAADNRCTCELTWGKNSYKGMVFNHALNAEL